MISAKFVDYSKLKEMTKLLNEHEFVEKIKLTSPKEVLYEQFMKGIVALTDEQADKDTLEPAVLFYNEMVEGTDPEEPPAEEKPKKPAKADKPKKEGESKKPPFPKSDKPSFEAVAQTLWETGDSSEETFFNKFKELYTERGRGDDEEFIKNRVEIYRSIGYKRAEKAGTLPEGAEKPSKPRSKKTSEE